MKLPIIIMSEGSHVDAKVWLMLVAQYHSWATNVSLHSSAHSLVGQWYFKIASSLVQGADYGAAGIIDTNCRLYSTLTVSAIPYGSIQCFSAFQATCSAVFSKTDIDRVVLQ